MDFTTDILEPYEQAVEHAIVAKTHAVNAKRVIDSFAVFSAAAEAVNEVLPDDMKIVAELDTEQSAELAKLLGTPAQSEALRDKRRDVEAALQVATLVGMDDETQERARKAIARHTSELQVVQESTAKSQGGGARNLKSTIAATGPDMNRTSPKGDWTSIRWQLNEHSVQHGGIAAEALNTVLPKLKAVDSGEVPSVEIALTAGDGTEYKVLYPAA